MQDCFQHRRKTVGSEMMNKDEKSRRVAPAKKEEATCENEDWKNICEKCEILRLYNDCTFGCELVKASLEKKKDNKS
jgi:hypothetical protein